MSIFTPLRAKIIANLQAGLTKVASGQIYDSDASQFGGFPAISVSPDGNDADYHDTSARQYDIDYTVRAYQSISDAGQQSADAILDEVMDELLAIFNDKSLSWTPAEWVIPTPGTWGYQDRTEGQVRVAELKVKCRVYLTS